jgi:hypothetical protein
MSLYYECHLNIEPVFGDRLEQLKKLCESKNFHVAKLLMQKDANGDIEISRKDSFCTGHSQTYEDILDRMVELIQLLTEYSFEIWRYKIEDCVLDSRKNDTLELLT